MGEFLRMTALRGVDPADVAAALVNFAAENGLPAEIRTAGTVTSGISAVIHTPVNGWAVISWSRNLAFLLKVSRWLSEKLDTVACVVDIYDSDAWSYAAFSAGVDKDRYASEPELKTSDWTPSSEAQQRWRGDAEATAKIFACAPTYISPYFVDPRHVPNTKAFPNDSTTVDDPWVAVDFLNRLGISLPRMQRSDTVAVQFPDLPSPYPIFDTTRD
jgi:hypothetical protein